MKQLKYTSEQLRQQFEDYLENKAFEGFPEVLLQPTKHILQIKGKRIRPMLLLTACQAFGGDVQNAMGPAATVEVFHNFSLVHDDIIDEADIRRGQPTVHKVFGTYKAILAGDAMLIHTYNLLQKAPAEKLPELLPVYNKVAMQVIDGEQHDVDFEDLPEVTAEEYMKMIEYKTSVLLAASLHLGSIIGNASREDQQLIYDFGLKLGLAFQIKDDYLDSFGDAATFGKRIGGDILMNKKTYLLVTALSIAGDKDRQAIFDLFEEKDEEKKIASMLALFEKLGVRQKTYARMEELYKEAMRSLNALSIVEIARQPLLDLANSIYHRSF
ncbi:MAG: polyprenyl synthetase family protein [Bacteroidales bacterium]|nr:polyprenyl synthetase family protein [Bacteroidales bacterium]